MNTFIHNKLFCFHFLYSSLILKWVALSRIISSAVEDWIIHFSDIHVISSFIFITII